MAMTLPASNGKVVLITGLNGYIASHIGLQLLSKGYTLHGTTRRPESITPLLQGPYAIYHAADRIKIFSVPDMTIPGAFDSAAQGVHGIVHTASPISFALTTYEAVIGQAKVGTTVLLQSALTAGPQLKNVVVTSSVAAVVEMDGRKPDEEYVFTEQDFARSSLERSEREYAEGGQTPSGVLYMASKTAAEAEVWKFRDTVKPSFSLVAVNPSVVIGPPLLLPANPGALNETLKPVYSILSGQGFPGAIGTGSFVDVRDTAKMHVWALEHGAEVDGERFISSAGYGPPQAIADVLRERYPEFRDRVQAGTPGQGYIGFEDGKVKEVKYPHKRIRVSGEKAQKVMGIEWTTFPQSIVDTAEVLKGYL